MKEDALARAIKNHPNYFHRDIERRLGMHNRLAHLTPLKCLDDLSPEKLSGLNVICETNFISDTAFTDRDVNLVLRNHAPLTAEAYSTYRYHGKAQSSLSMKFYSL